MGQFDDYVTVADAAERLGIHPESVRRLIRGNQLPAKKYLHTWLIQRDVLEQFASGYDARPGNKATLFKLKQTRKRNTEPNEKK
jgi:excisionase family DNA binding protein